jgi:hypothetical protein
MIQLNDGTTVAIASILIFMLRNGVTEMPISQQHVDIFDHTEYVSLDFVLRTHAVNMATAQATALVIEQLITSGYFEPAQVRSPETGRMVKGIRAVL